MFGRREFSCRENDGSGMNSNFTSSSLHKTASNVEALPVALIADLSV